MTAVKFLPAAVLGCCLLHAGFVAAQGGGVATYSKEAMDNVSPLLKKAAQDGFQMQSRTTTIFGGWLGRGQGQGTEPWQDMLFVELDAANVYRIVAAGDNDVEDLDLRIVDPTGKIVVQDDAVRRDAEVSIRPERRQRYTIQMRLYKSKDNSICIGAIFRK